MIGLRFDHLWVMGLHHEAWPQSANPNPFLPIALQREHKLPHSSADRELEFAAKVMEHGEIALEGTAQELARDARVVETYLGAQRRS